MTKALKKVLITVLSALFVLVTALTLAPTFTTSRVAKADSAQTIEFPDTTGYYQLEAVEGISLKDRVVRIYKDMDGNIPEVDLGEWTLYPESGLLYGASVFVAPLAQETSTYIDIYMNYEYMCAETNRVWLEDDPEEHEYIDFSKYPNSFVLFSSLYPEYEAYVLLPMPDTSKVKAVEPADYTTNLIGKVLRVYDVAEGKHASFELSINGPLPYLDWETGDPVLNLSEMSTGLPYVVGDGYVDYIFHEEILYLFKAYDDADEAVMFACILDFDTGETVRPEDYVDPVMFNISDLYEEPSDDEEEKSDTPILDKLDEWAGSINEQTGWALTGSALGGIIVIAVIVILIRRRR